jgi:hypothetical protein
MKIRNKLSMVIAGAIFIVLGTVGTTKAETIILESGSFIPSQVDPNAGYAIVGTQTVDQFLGWRFQLNNTLQVTDVGGYLSSYGNIFAAIVSLSSPTGDWGLGIGDWGTGQRGTSKLNLPNPERVTAFQLTIFN